MEVNLDSLDDSQDQAARCVSPSRKHFSRKNFYFLFLLSFLLPQIVWGISLFFSRTTTTRPIVLSGLFFSLVGVLSILLLTRGWERKMQRSVSALVQAKLQHLKTGTIQEGEGQIEHLHQEIRHLHQFLEESQRGYEHQIDLLQSSAAKSKLRAEECAYEIENKSEDLRRLTIAMEEMGRDFERQMDEQRRTTEGILEGIHHKERVLHDYQLTITEQRKVIEKKQRYIAQLEGKVKDLMYEIRSLLQLEEPLSSSSASSLVYHDDSLQEISLMPLQGENSTYDLSLQLQRYIQMAQHFTGIDHLGYVNGQSPRFLDISFESYAIDQRRLFDTFRDETVGIIFVYSLKEERFLFINNLVRTVLGWSSEKFMKDFSHLIEMGYPEWNQALAKISSLKEAQLRLLIRSKTGEEILCQCFMGLVSQGPFVNHVIGILAPV